jgi:hypothetical protein
LIPRLKIEVQAEIRDKNGKVIRRTRKKLCRSYVRQMIDLLYAEFALDSGVITKDTAGTMRSIWNPAGYWKGLGAACGAASTLYGILAGTGASPTTISDHVIQTLITHGDTSTKLNYGATSVGTVAIVGSTAKFTIARTLTNNSGADISVTEVVLVLACTSTVYYFLVERTLLSFTITNGTSGTVTYTISVTV